MRILALEDSIFWILVVDSQRDYLLRKDVTLIIREEWEKGGAYYGDDANGGEDYEDYPVFFD